MTVAKSNINVRWEHFNSKRPGHRITKCVLIENEELVDTAFVETFHQSKNDARKESLNAVLQKNYGEKSKRRTIWESYFQMRGRY